MKESQKQPGKPAYKDPYYDPRTPEQRRAERMEVLRGWLILGSITIAIFAFAKLVLV